MYILYSYLVTGFICYVIATLTIMRDPDWENVNKQFAAKKGWTDVRLVYAVNFSTFFLFWIASVPAYFNVYLRIRRRRRTGVKHIERAMQGKLAEYGVKGKVKVTITG